MSYLPPVLVGHSITVAPGHTVISLEFNEQIERGNGTIIVTDGALQTVIDRATGVPTTRIVGATDTREIPLSMVGIDGTKAAINADGLIPGHDYRVFVLPGVLQSNGQPFAGVSNGSLLAFNSGAALDTMPPGLTQISLDHWAFNTTNASAHLTLAFTEKVAFTSAALHATGLTFANLASADGGLTWTADVAAQPNVDMASPNISLDMSMVKDLTGNAGSGFQLASYNIDTKRPSVASILLANATPSLSASSTVTVKFSETVHNLGSNVIVAPHAVVSDLHTTDGGITWVASLAPASGGASSGNQLYVDLTQLSDLSGNAGTGSVNAPVTYNVAATLGLTASITLSDTRLNQKSGAVTATIQFNQAVKGLDVSNFHFTNADLTSLTTTDNITWHGTLTSHANIQAITNTFSLDLGMVQDSAGNYGSGTVSVGGGYVVDTVPPTVTLSLDGGSITTTHGITLTATFSEPVQALNASYFSTPGATLTNLVSNADGSVWTATLNAGGSSSTGNNVSLDMTKVQDLNGNAGSGTSATTTGYSVDSTPASATIAFDHTGLSFGGDIHATIVFPSTMSSLPISALSASNVTIIDEGHSDSNGTTTWHLTLVPNSIGVVSTGNVLSLDMTKVLDSSGHAGSGTVTSPAYSIDSTVGSYASVIALADDTGGHVNFIDGYTDFVTSNAQARFVGQLSSVLANNQHVEVTIDGTQTLTTTSYGNTWVYSPAVAPTLAEGSHTVAVHVVDDAGHSSAVLTQTMVVDTKAPQVLSTSAGTGTQDVGQSLQISFNEPVLWHGIIATSESDAISWSDADNFVELVHGGIHERVYIDTNNLSSDGKKLTISANDLHLASGADYQVVLPAALTDKAGNDLGGTAISFKTSGSYADSSAPRIMAAMAVNQGYFGIGAQIEFAVKFNEPVKLGSTVPELTLNNGAKATFESLSSPDHRTAYFVYTVAAADATPSGGILNVTGMGTMPDTITDLSGNKLAAGALSLSTLDGSYPYGNVYIDTTLPATITSAPVLNSATDSGTKGDSITNVLQPGLHGTGATFGDDLTVYEVTGDTLRYLGSAVVNSDGTWNLDSTYANLADGTHHVAVAQTNAVGNTGYLSPTLTVTIDHTANALAAPTIDVSSDDGTVGDLITTVTKPKLNGSGAEAGAKVDVLEGTSLLGSAVAGSDGSWSFTPTTALGVGSHNLVLHQTDVAGNVSADTTVALTIGSTVTWAPPAKLSAPVLASDSGSSSSDGITNVTMPTITGGGANAQVPIELYDNGTLVTSGTSDTQGAWSLVLNQHDLAEGSHSFTVRQLDSAHNNTPGAFSNALQVTIDTTGPAQLGAPVLAAVDDSGSSASDGVTNVSKPHFTGSGAEANATIKLWDGDSLIGTTTADGSGNWKVTPSSALLDGTHGISVSQVDVAGNEGALSGAISVTIDTVAPTVSYNTSVTPTGSYYLWFSEPVDHSALTGYADITNSRTNNVTHIDLTDSSHWTTITVGDHTTTAFTFAPSALDFLLLDSGTVSVTLTGVKDLAGNTATIGHANYTFQIQQTY